MIGIGIGILLATILMFHSRSTSSLTKAQIEQKATEMGMKWPKDFKVINEKVDKK